ncbi:DoxX family protein, partial [Akkermansiaceae bacterium]|nr:DoxX family protein [Akkermansiaceae bacterium]
STAYRGGEASSMREEFSTYGLPASMMYVVGGLKVIIALAMIAGLWIPALVIPAAVVLIVLMAGAFVMHLKVKDPFKKSIPAILMMDIAILIIVFSVFFTQP